jgi:hypothetical protein
VATALQLYASQLRTTARSLAERLTASILAPLIRVASRAGEPKTHHNAAGSRAS